MKQASSPIFAFCLAACAPQYAFAHAASTSFLVVQLRDDAAPVEVRWDMSLQDLAWTVFIDADYDGNVTWLEVQNAKSAIGRRCSRRSISSAVVRPACSRIEDFALAVRTEQNFLSVAMLATVRAPASRA